MKREKRKPHDFLVNLLERAKSHRLITSEEAFAVASQGDECIQSNIDIWCPLVFEAEKKPIQNWALAISVCSHSTEIFERINEEIFHSYFDATTACRQANKATFLKRKCRVVEFSRTVPSASAMGRSAHDLFALSSNGTIDNFSDWIADKTNSGGYLALQGKGMLCGDVPGILSLCNLAEGAFTQLGLSRNSLDAHGAMSLAGGLLLPPPAQQDKTFHFSRVLCALFLSSNNVGDAGAIAIADVLSSGLLPQLVKIGLNDNQISDIGATRLAETFDSAMTPSTSLQVIGLSQNNISSQGALALAYALSHNTTLKRLFLNSNGSILNAGATALAEAFQDHPTLKRLGLSHCGLDSEAGMRLASSLRCNDTMERVCVGGNSFDSPTESAMMAMSRFNFREVQS
jgi:hypothetical protein